MDYQHDSLCRQQYWTGDDCFDCRLIARVRADERAKAHVHATGTSSGDGPCCECCYDANAARAEVAVLRDQIAGMYQAETFTDTDGYPSTRVFKAEVVGQNEWAAHIRREVLADLRTKVEGLPVLVTDMHNGTGPHYYEHTVLLAAVLALIDGARRPPRPRSPLTHPGR